MHEGGNNNQYHKNKKYVQVHDCVLIFMMSFNSFTGTGCIPKAHELQSMEGPNGERLKIIETVAPSWKKMALALGFNPPRIEIIEQESFYQIENACNRMFFEWLAGAHDLKPSTWDTLIKCLEFLNFSDLARKLGFLEIVKSCYQISDELTKYTNNQ